MGFGKSKEKRQMTRLLQSAEQQGRGGARVEGQVRKGWTPLITGSCHRS